MGHVKSILNPPPILALASCGLGIALLALRRAFFSDKGQQQQQQQQQQRRRQDCCTATAPESELLSAVMGCQSFNEDQVDALHQATGDPGAMLRLLHEHEDPAAYYDDSFYAIDADKIAAAQDAMLLSDVLRAGPITQGAFWGCCSYPPRLDDWASDPDVICHTARSDASDGALGDELQFEYLFQEDQQDRRCCCSVAG